MAPNRNLRTTLSLLLLASLTGPAAGGDKHDHDHRQQDAHVHGIAELNVAVDADALLVELNSPAMNLVGFEHPPHTEAERAAIEAARARLQDGAALFVPNAEAQCVQISTLVTLELGEHDDTEHGHDHDHEQAHEHHADGHGEWSFTCAKPVLLERLDVRLFEAFPGTERLRVQLITSAGQRGEELTAERHLLDL
jgi:hypothetical protein